jgi:hypothetical protein
MTSKNKQVALDQEIRYHLPLLGSSLQALGKEVVATGDAMVEEEVDIITIVHNLLQILLINGVATEAILTEVQDDTIEETEIAAALAADEIQIEVHMEIVGIEIEAIEKRADMMIPFLEICSDPKSKAPRG